MFAVRRELLEALFSDHKWKARVEKAKTWEQVEKVITEFAKTKGFKIKNVKGTANGGKQCYYEDTECWRDKRPYEGSLICTNCLIAKTLRGFHPGTDTQREEQRR